ncbi:MULTISPECIES: hypothetical protein [Rhodobacterales]|uniref:hypothetical protein n=1 Tax=Rhodobacterales TaxID=204455 RepID=UPI00110825D5|nr:MULTISPECIES: hypothetical protein [Rhodobacterales]
MKIYEALLFWCGAITAEKAAKLIGCTRAHAQMKVVSQFNAESRYPARTVRKGPDRGKTLETVPSIQPHTLNEWCDFISAHKVFGKHKENDAEPIIPDIEKIRIDTPPDLRTAKLLRALSQKSAVRGTYIFKDYGAKDILFSPHSLVQSPRRPHLRGHLQIYEKNSLSLVGFRDIVPSRFLSDELTLDHDAFISDSGDTEWHEFVTVRARLNPTLPRDFTRSRSLELGHDPEDGTTDFVLSKRIRKALLYYFEKDIFSETLGHDSTPVWDIVIEDGQY